VSNPSVPLQGENAISMSSVDNPLMENPVVVSNSTGAPGGLPSVSANPVVMPAGQEFLIKQGVPQLITWPISGNPIHHRDFLQKLQALCSPHGEIKPIPTIIPPLLNGLAGVTNGVEISFQDL